ncbi:MAG: hypothetical protein U1E10_09600 [Bdellovibrionales bacterium]|nr:hypothetical protein [Bdellovibrionales bacterium]
MKKQIGLYLTALLAIPLLGLGTNAFGFQNPTPTPAASQPQYITPGGGGNAAEAGRSTSNTQLIGAAVNIAAAGMYMGVCMKPYCAGCWACPLVGLAGAAASLLGNASGQSGSAGMQMSNYDPYYDSSTGSTGGTTDPWGNPLNPDGTSGTGGPGASGPTTAGTGGGLPPGTTPQTIARDVARLRTELEKSGVKLSPDGKSMTTPDGRKFDLSKAGSGSESDMLAMGMTAAEAAQANAMGKQFAAKQAEKFKQMSQLAGAGGGGGGRGLASDGGAGGEGGYGAGFDPWGRDPRNRNRAKPKLSGLTKKLGDDTIGVSGDDIFEMVTRRYKARDQENHFLKD